MDVLKEAAVSVQEAILRMGLEDAVIPLREGKKQPKISHKSGTWTGERALAWFSDDSNYNENMELGICCRGLIVLDFDEILFSRTGEGGAGRGGSGGGKRV